MEFVFLMYLFTSLPINIAGEAVQKIWPNYAVDSKLDVMDIVVLVMCCLASNCFVFEENVYRQISGTAMGSLMSVQIA